MYTLHAFMCVALTINTNQMGLSKAMLSRQWAEGNFKGVKNMFFY